MTFGKPRNWVTVIGLLAVVALLVPSTLSAAPQAGLEAHIMSHFGMPHGDHVGTTHMAAHKKDLEKSVPCDNRNGTGDPNCCIGTVCPMSLATLGLIHDSSEDIWVAPPSFVAPPPTLLIASAHTAIFRPPIQA